MGVSEIGMRCLLRGRRLLWDWTEALSTPRTRSPVVRAGSRSLRARASQRGRREVLCLRADLRHETEATVVRSDEITRTSGQPAGDLPVRRRGRCSGAPALFESGVRTLARLVSCLDAAQGNGANSQGVGEREEHDIIAGTTHRSG
jgi:hypothetical protein